MRRLLKDNTAEAQEGQTMILQLNRSRRKQILVDVDTQKDFLLAGGKCCIRNHRRVLAHIRRLMAWARARRIPIISTAEVYSPNGDNGNGHYCVDGTDGQRKIRYTLLTNRLSFAADGNTDLPRDMLRRYDQVILHKRCIDPFEEPRIERLLSEIRAADFILVGAGTESAVLWTALGLLQRGKTVTVVTDAIGSHNKREADMAMRKLEAKGARLIDTKRLAGTSQLLQVRACDCDSCMGVKRKACTGRSG